MQKDFKILIVDDNIELAQNLKDILEEKGYGTGVASDGKRTTKLCQEDEFDLALVDMKLSDIDGLKLIAKMSKITQGMEYIIITGHGSIESATEAVKLRRIVAYETKPINIKSLLILIQQINERKLAEKAHKRAEEQIQRDLKEKEVLLKEIHHCVKNNLQIIHSLLALQSTNVKNKRVLEAFNECKGRIKSMALIHEKLYQSEDFARVDFTDYIQSLVINLFHTYNVHHDTIRVKTQLKNITLGIDKAIPCGMLINELVTNALRHAFPDGRKGTIRIGLYSSNDKHTLLIMDDGIGLPVNIYTRQSKSLGLQLVNSLVDQLGGTLEVIRRKGTTFKVMF